MTDGSTALNMRWIKVSPASAAPAYGCVEVTGTSIVDNDLVVNVKRPSQDNLPPSKVMFISSCAISGGEIGLGTYSFPTWALATAAASPGTTVGTQKNSYELAINNKGFYVEGTGDGRARVKPQPFNDESCTPTGRIYSRRYECLPNPTYLPDSTATSANDPEADTYDCCDFTNPRGYLYEFLDYYEWDEESCEWIEYVAQEPERKIMCCDPRCAEYEKPTCSPCAPSSIDVLPATCCGTTHDITVTFDCYSAGGESGSRALPTRVWLEYEVCDSLFADSCTAPDEMVELAGSSQDFPNGADSATFTLDYTEIAACPAEDKLVAYRVCASVCDEPNSPAVCTNVRYMLWKYCTDPECATCPDDAAQSDPQAENNFSFPGTLSGIVGPDQTRTFNWDVQSNAWVAIFEAQVLDPTPGAEVIEDIKFEVHVQCYQDPIGPLFGDLAAGSPFYCVDGLNIPAGQAFDSDVSYNTQLSITNFSANAILNGCALLGALPNDQNLTLTIDIGECTS